jgi:hypothetical protein
VAISSGLHSYIWILYSTLDSAGDGFGSLSLLLSKISACKTALNNFLLISAVIHFLLLCGKNKPQRAYSDVPHHVSHCCTDVATGIVETGISRPGGQSMGEVAHGAMPPAATVAGGQAPTKETSCRRIWAAKLQGLKNPGMEWVLGILPGSAPKGT